MQDRNRAGDRKLQLRRRRGATPGGDEYIGDQFIFHVGDRLQQPVSREGHTNRASPSLCPKVDAERLLLAAVARKVSERGLEIMEADRNLLEIIAALGLPRRFARCLNCRQEQRYEYSNDRDDDQELDESEPGRAVRRQGSATNEMRLAIEAALMIGVMPHRFPQGL